MTTDELMKLHERTMARSHEIEQKYRMGQPLTRGELLEFQKCNERLHVITKELWLAQGKPPGFECVEKPFQRCPLPLSLQAHLPREGH